MSINKLPMNYKAVKVIPRTGLAGLCYSILIQDSTMTEVNIPTGVTKIRSYLFNDNWPDNKFSVTVPEGVTEIADYAFTNCSMDKIELPSTITTIPSNAFTDASVNTIVINKTANSISGSPWGADGATVEWKG